MTLDRYLSSIQMTSAAFAKKLGVSLPAVNKWRQRTRTPRPPMVVKIRDATKGKVGPADWYPAKI